MAFANPLPKSNALVWILMDRCRCGGQVDDNSEGFRIISLFGAAPLEPAPFAQHPTLLLVAKGPSVTGPLGGVLLPGYPGCPHRLRQEREVFHEGRMLKLADGKLARRLHGFSNKCPFSIIITPRSTG
jgi:hypothetical protein